MAWRGEVEDGLGWGGLVASKSEQREEARMAALERDAARFRWLRDMLEKSDAEAYEIVEFAYRGGLTSAIDAAMSVATDNTRDGGEE